MHDPKVRSPTRLSGLTALIANGNWAIKPDQLRDIVTGFEGYLRGNRAADHLIQEARDARTRQADTLQVAQDQVPAVALVALHGTIFPRGSLMVEYCGAIDAHTFAARIRAAADDPQVTSIVIDVDSGGGAVSGVDAAAAAVRYAAGLKRTTAIANTTMCSAAYWIASGATEIVCTPAAEVGSIGVIGTHTDQSAQLEQEGLKVTYVRSTERKALGQSAEPMAGIVLEQWQSEIGRLHELFVQDIALGRNVTLQKASSWATGDVWFGQEAVNVGLVDATGTLDSVLQEHMTAAAQPTRTARRGAHKENPVKLDVKDRTGKTHTIDTEATSAQAELQTLFTAAEQSAYAAGIDQQKEVVATALGIEPKDTTPTHLTKLADQARDGTTYRSALEARVEELAVSVYGADSSGVSTMKRLSQAADVEGLKGLVDDLTARKSAAYPDRRLSREDHGGQPAEGAEGPQAAKAPVVPARTFDF